MALKINFLEIYNSLYDKIIAQFGFFILISQSYSTYYFFSLIIDKKIHKKKIVDLYILITMIIKTGIKIIKIFFPSNHFSNHIIHQSKTVFFISFSGYLAIQFIYIIPILIQTYFFLNDYLVEDKFKKLTKCLFQLTLLKTIFEYYQMFFLEYFRIFLYEHAPFFNVVRQESDMIYTCLQMFSFISNLYFVYYIFQINNINKNRKIQEVPANHFDEICNPKEDYYFYIHKNNLTEVTQKNQSIIHFMTDISFESIKKKTGITQKHFRIEKNKNALSSKFSIIDYHAIKIFLQRQNFILLDVLKEIKETTLLLYNKEEISFEKKIIIEVVEYLEKEEIRLLYQIKGEEETKGLILLHTNSFSENPYLEKDEIEIIFPYLKKIFDNYKEKNQESLYSQFEYEQKLSELKIFDVSMREKNIYEEISKKIKDIETILIYENQKIISLIPEIESKHLTEELKKNHLAKISEKNNLSLELAEFIYSNENQKIMVTNKNKISFSQKNHLSFYATLPLLDKEESNFDLIHLHQDTVIKKIFSSNNTHFSQYLKFLNTINLGFRVKIIFNEEFWNPSFFKIISYKIKNFFIIDGSDISFIKTIKEKNNLVNREKNELIHFFIKNFDKNTIENQNYFLFWYQETILKEPEEYCKCYLIMEKKEKHKFLSKKLLFSSEIISLETINSSLFSLNEQTLLLKNYFLLIEKIAISEKDLISYLPEKINSHSIHHLIDTVSKKIQFFKEKSNQNYFISEAIKLGKKSTKNIFILHELKHQFPNNKKKIASLLNTHRSTISRIFKNKY